MTISISGQAEVCKLMLLQWHMHFQALREGLNLRFYSDLRFYAPSWRILLPLMDQSSPDLNAHSISKDFHQAHMLANGR